MNVGVKALGEEERDNLVEEAAIAKEEEGDKRHREEGDSHRHYRRCHVGKCRDKVVANKVFGDILYNLDNIYHGCEEEVVYRVLELAKWLAQRLSKAVPVERE